MGVILAEKHPGWFMVEKFLLMKSVDQHKPEPAVSDGFSLREAPLCPCCVGKAILSCQTLRSRPRMDCRTHYGSESGLIHQQQFSLKPWSLPHWVHWKLIWDLSRCADVNRSWVFGPDRVSLTSTVSFNVSITLRPGRRIDGSSDLRSVIGAALLPHINHGCTSHPSSARPVQHL